MVAIDVNALSLMMYFEPRRITYWYGRVSKFLIKRKTMALIIHFFTWYNNLSFKLEIGYL